MAGKSLWRAFLTRNNLSPMVPRCASSSGARARRVAREWRSNGSSALRWRRRINSCCLLTPLSSSNSIAQQKKPRAAVLVIDDAARCSGLSCFPAFAGRFRVATATAKGCVQAVKPTFRYCPHRHSNARNGWFGYPSALRKIQEDIQVIVARLRSIRGSSRLPKFRRLWLAAKAFRYR